MKIVLTLHIQVGRSLNFVDLADVFAAVIRMKLSDDQCAWGAIVSEVVLQAMENLWLVFVPSEIQ